MIPLQRSLLARPALALVPALALGFALTLAAAPARSGVTLEMREVGGDVVLSGSGELKLDAWTPFLSGAALGGQVSPGGYFLTGPPGALVDVYEAPVNFSGPSSIGPGVSVVSADSGSGHAFGLNFAVMRLGHRANAGSETRMEGSSTWVGHTLASLGVTPGTYHWTWGSGATADSLTLHAIGGACTDTDGDGYGEIGHVDCPGGLSADCDDTDPLVHPGAADVCDGVDNNCDGEADEAAVCSASLVDGSLATLSFEVVQGAPASLEGDFPVVLGAPEATSAPLVDDFTIDLDVENESISFVLTNNGGGKGNVAVVARITGLEWTDARTHILGASFVSSDFDYVYASTPPPFSAPGVAGIVDSGHGIEIYFEELLLQSGEVHSVTVSFAAGTTPHPSTLPALSGPGVAVLAVVVGGLGLVVARRRPR